LRIEFGESRPGAGQVKDTPWG